MTTVPIILFGLKKYWAKLDKDKKDKIESIESISNTAYLRMEDDYTFWWVMSLFVGLCLGAIPIVAGFDLLGTGIKQILNPEYYVIMDILNTFKGN